MDQDLVVRLNQAAIDGIRAAGATTQYIHVEGNNWNDTFWGVCRGKGRNELGKVLMKVRSELSKE